MSSPNPPSVFVILVTWNGKADTLACLASLNEDRYPARRVIVVDNGSSDDSIAVIRDQYPDTIVLENGANLGFAGGNNAGIRYALENGADYIYLLNNDTTSDSNSITELVNAANAHPEYAVLSPVIHYFDEPSELWFAGSTMNLKRGEAIHDNAQSPPREAAPHTIPWASGCAMFFRANVLRKLSGFDERFFIYWEDVDLSLRVRSLGHDIGLVPASRIYHKVSRSPLARTSNGCYYYVRNNLLLLKTHAGKSYPGAAIRFVCGQLRKSVRAIVRRNYGNAESIPATMRAIRDHLRHRYGKLQ